MSALNLGLVLLAQYLIGRGTLRLVCPIPSAIQRFSLSFLLGLPVSTFVIMVLDVLGVRITLTSFLVGAGLLYCPAGSVDASGVDANFQGPDCRPSRCIPVSRSD